MSIVQTTTIFDDTEYIISYDFDAMRVFGYVEGEFVCLTGPCTKLNYDPCNEADWEDQLKRLRIEAEWLVRTYKAAPEKVSKLF